MRFSCSPLRDRKQQKCHQRTLKFEYNSWRNRSETKWNQIVEIDTKAVIVDTQTGRTARYLAAFRNRSPVYSACYSERVVRELALSYGVTAFFMEPRKQTDAFKRSIARHLSEIPGIEMDDRILLIGGSYGPRRGASFLEISLVRDLVSL